MIFMELLQLPVHAVALVTCVGQKLLICHELLMLLICIWKAHKWFKMRGLLMLPFCIWAPLDGLKLIRNRGKIRGVWLHWWAHVLIK